MRQAAAGRASCTRRHASKTLITGTQRGLDKGLGPESWPSLQVGEEHLNVLITGRLASGKTWLALCSGTQGLPGRV